LCYKHKIKAMPKITFNIPDDLDLRLITYVKKRRITGEKTTKVKACIRLISDGLKNYE
jgi:hypothetical protein